MDLVISETMSLPQWVESQHKAFIRWCNMNLQAAGYPPLNDLRTDFTNGVQLIHLVEAVSHESMGKYHANPSPMQKYENISIVLDYLKHRDIVLHGIGAPDVAEGNLKLILGLIWTMILKYTVQEISEEGFNAKEGLLLWCQRKTAEYEDVDVRDFHSSWKSGLAFAALVDHYRPDLLDYATIDKSDPKKVIAASLDAAEQAGIPKLLEVEDVCGLQDEKPLVTYLAYWFHAFSALESIERAGSYVERFLDVYTAAMKMKKDYERRMQALLDEIDQTMESWKEMQSETLKDAIREHESLLRYKNTTKRKWITEKAQLAELLSNIRIKLTTFSLREYVTPEKLSMSHLNSVWAKLLRSETKWSLQVAQQFQKHRDDACRKFADLANEMAISLTTISNGISGVSGELENQLLEISYASESLAPMDAKLDDLQELEERCRLLGVEENNHTVYSFDEIAYELDLVKVMVENKLIFIENHMAARDATNITPAQLEEYEVVFRHFDKNQKNVLDRRGFLDAVASLGITFEDDPEGAEEVWLEQAKDGGVSFRSFIMYMVSATEDSQNIEQLRESLKEISCGKRYVTRTDLENALLPDETIDSLVELMPEIEEDKYDYASYIENIISEAGSDWQEDSTAQSRLSAENESTDASSLSCEK